MHPMVHKTPRESVTFALHFFPIVDHRGYAYRTSELAETNGNRRVQPRAEHFQDHEHSNKYRSSRTSLEWLGELYPDYICVERFWSPDSPYISALGRSIYGRI